MSSVVVSMGIFGEEYGIGETREKMDEDVGFLSTKRAERTGC